jgi:hypothetical protein
MNILRPAQNISWDGSTDNSIGTHNPEQLSYGYLPQRMRFEEPKGNLSAYPDCCGQGWSDKVALPAGLVVGGIRPYLLLLSINSPKGHKI